MNEDKIDLSQEIFSRFGTVKRARKCFLYTSKGVRLTDLYQEGGRAILGWGGSAFTVFKNVLERGITGSYFTDFSSPNGKNLNPLERAIFELFGDKRTVFTFSSIKLAFEAALSLSPQATGVWRPWNPGNIDFCSEDCILFVPTLPWTNDIFILAVKDEILKQYDSNNASGRLQTDDLPVQNDDFLGNDKEKIAQNKSVAPNFVRHLVPNQTFLSSPLCAAVTRSIYDLIKALQEREEKHWFIYDKILTKYWERRGPYLFPKIPEKKYTEFIRHCLDCNLVISPEYHKPSIVPFGADKGVFRLLEKNPFKADKK